MKYNIMIYLVENVFAIKYLYKYSRQESFSREY